MKTPIAVVLASLLAFPNCARLLVGPQGPHRPRVSAAHIDPQILRHFMEKVPVGSEVRLELNDGLAVKGVLIAVDAGGIIVQPRTRDQPPRTIRFSALSIVEIEPGPSAKTAARAHRIVMGTLSAIVMSLLLYWVASSQ